MDAETLARATDPCFTTKGVGKGTGLGLAMVKGPAEQSNGFPRLESKLHHGTRAELWLPISRQESLLASRQVEVPPNQPHTLRILAVDDDPLILLNTVAMLEEMGHSVIEPASAQKASVLLEAGKTVDVVVTDQAMPQMTGLELALAIKQKWPSTRLVSQPVMQSCRHIRM